MGLGRRFRKMSVLPESAQSTIIRYCRGVCWLVLIGGWKQIRAASIRANDPNIYIMSAHIYSECKPTDLFFNHDPPCMSPRHLSISILSNLHCYASKITEIFQIFLHFSHDEAQPFVSSMFRSRENFHQSAHKSAMAERYHIETCILQSRVKKCSRDFDVRRRLGAAH